MREPTVSRRGLFGWLAALPLAAPFMRSPAVAHPDVFQTAALPAHPDYLQQYACEWLRDGVPILGADGATYMFTENDQGCELSLRVTPAWETFLENAWRT